MKSADIKPGIDYAVRLPAKIDFPHIGGTVVRARAGSHTEKGKRVFDVYAYERSDPHARSRPATKCPARMLMLAPQNVLMTWEQHVFEADWSEAIRMDDMWEYNREREQEAERMRPFVDAFRGIMVPGKSVASANFELPDVDLGEYLHDAFVTGRTAATTFSFATFEAVAKVLLAQQQAILDAGGIWAGGTSDTGRPTITTLPPRADLDRIEARLAELSEAECGGSGKVAA